MKHPGTEWGSQWRVVWYNPSRYKLPGMLPTAEQCQWCDVVVYDPIPNLPAQKVPTVLLSAAETWCFTCQLFQLSLSGRQGTKHWNSHFSTFEQSFSWDGWRHQTMLQNRGTQTCQEQAEIARVEGSPVQRPLLQMLAQVIASSGHRCWNVGSGFSLRLLSCDWNG